MLRPAICYKEQLESALKPYFYSGDMLYYTFSLGSSLIQVQDCSSGDCYQYAVLDRNENLIGYIGYTVDWYGSCAYKIMAFSFDKGNIIMGRDLQGLLEALITKFHRVEFCAASVNPATRGYDRFLKKHSGRKVVLRDICKGPDGQFYDEYIYEFINDAVK